MMQATECTNNQITGKELIIMSCLQTSETTMIVHTLPGLFIHLHACILEFTVYNLSCRYQLKVHEEGFITFNPPLLPRIQGCSRIIISGINFQGLIVSWH